MDIGVVRSQRSIPAIWNPAYSPLGSFCVLIDPILPAGGFLLDRPRLTPLHRRRATIMIRIEI